jgi:uncharacterized protein UPF0547
VLLGYSAAVIVAVVLFWLVVIALAVWLVRRVFRIVAWPFRKARRPPATGLGADYEQMVRTPDAGKRWERLRRLVIPGWLAVPLTYLGFFFIFFKPFGASWNLYAAALIATAVGALYARGRYRQVVLRRDERGMIVWLKWGREALQTEPPQVFIQDGTNPPASRPESPPATKLDDLLQRGLVTRAAYERLKAATHTPSTKACPDCAETILAAAKVCRYCHYRFDQAPDSETPVATP